MRIAILFYGHLRSFRQTRDSYKKFLADLNRLGKVDVFCHTWDTEESVTASWWKDKESVRDQPVFTNEEEVRNIYEPCLLNIEKTKQFTEPEIPVPSTIPVAGILSMLHSQWEAFQLVKRYEDQQGFRYDLVIKTRYDLLYELAPSFTAEMKKAAALDVLLLPTSNPYELVGSYSDVLAAGPRGLMEEYFNFSTDFPATARRYSLDGYKLLLPELCMSFYLKTRGIPVQELESLRVEILRKSGERFPVSSARLLALNKPQCFNILIQVNAETIIPAAGIRENNNRLIRKYTGWLENHREESADTRYVHMFYGGWTGIKSVARLAGKARKNTSLSPQVFKDFFEHVIRNAEYNLFKRFWITMILVLYSGTGVFYIRVLFNSLKKPEQD